MKYRSKSRNYVKSGKNNNLNYNNSSGSAKVKVEILKNFCWNKGLKIKITQGF
jgi:hypothetical protein